MITVNPNHKIAITGAGGWLGTELLETLLLQNGAATVASSVVCFGSKARRVLLSDGTELQIHSLAENFAETEFSGVVHLAFQTRDKVASLGHEQYCYENLKITSRAIELIETSKPKWVATVSSGAVNSYPGGPLENNVISNPYGFTKRIEETLLRAAAEAIGANLAVGRLWGAMGKFMPPNPEYAISDFISAGLGGREIVLNSTNKVFRRYVDAGEFMDVLVRTAEEKKNTTFDSGGHLVELGDLATLVAEKTGSEVKPRALNPEAEHNVYYPTSQLFEELASKFGVELASIKTLVERTIASHKATN